MSENDKKLLIGRALYAAVGVMENKDVRLDKMTDELYYDLFNFAIYKAKVNGTDIVYGDAMVNHVEVKPSWKDRMRMLFGKSMLVEVKNYVKEPISPIICETKAYALPIVFYTFKAKKIKQSSGYDSDFLMNTTNVPQKTISF